MRLNDENARAAIYDDLEFTTQDINQLNDDEFKAMILRFLRGSATEQQKCFLDILLDRMYDIDRVLQRVFRIPYIEALGQPASVDDAAPRAALQAKAHRRIWWSRCLIL